jgi:hypothetical protein
MQKPSHRVLFQAKENGDVGSRSDTPAFTLSGLLFSSSFLIFCPRIDGTYGDDESSTHTHVPQATGAAAETVKVTTTPVFSHIPRLQASKDFQVLVRVEAPPALQQHRRVPVDLAVVLDVGASTGAGTARLDAVKKAVKFIIRQIHDDDRLAVVGPSNYRLLPGFLNTRDARWNAEKSVDQLEPRGEFTSGAGLEEAIKVRTHAVHATFRHLQFTAAVLGS